MIESCLAIRVACSSDAMRFVNAGDSSIGVSMELFSTIYEVFSNLEST